MSREALTDGFYDRIKPRLHRRIGRELRLASRVLDLGCGSCELVQYLADTYHQQVTGVDVSSESFPKRRHSQGEVRFRCVRQTATKLKFAADESVDAVILFWALHEMERPDAILAEAYRVLRPGGEMLIVEFPRDSLAKKFWNEGYFSIEQVKRMLSKNKFDEVRVQLIEQKQIMWITGYRPSLECPERRNPRRS